MLSPDIHEKQQLSLMEAVVKAAAQGGLANVTARKIGALAGINEVYIYRYFENKDDLVSRTFTYADEHCLAHILDNFCIMDHADENYEECCHKLFTSVWNWIMERPEWCLFYVRYYYSSVYQKNSYEDHIRRFEVLVDKMRPACHPEAKVDIVLHHIVDTILGQARKQIMHPQDPDVARENAFMLVFSVLKFGKGI